ncbi:glycosyl transferase, partial [Arthrobacter livingstonensis]
MKTTKNPVLTTASTLGRLLLLVVTSIACGALVAGLFVPATALAATVANDSINMFNNLPASLDVNPPAQATTVLASDGSTIARFYEQDRQAV